MTLYHNMPVCLAYKIHCLKVYDIAESDYCEIWHTLEGESWLKEWVSILQTFIELLMKFFKQRLLFNCCVYSVSSLSI